MVERAVERTYLELCDRASLRGRPLPDDARVVRPEPLTPDAYRALYRLVGERWHWRDRLAWNDAQLAAHLASPRVHVRELRVGPENRVAGYFELEQRDPDEIEIAYFGLASEFIGRGLGAALLTRAVEDAWSLGAKRVWLHTCTLDSPYALPNYRARGFSEFRRETYSVDVEE